MASPGRPLARGRTAEIFPWEDGLVVKLFHPGVSIDTARREAAAARIACGLGVPTPEVLDLVEVSGRAGIVFQRVAGPNMMQIILSEPNRRDEMAVLLAEFHAGLLGVSPACDPSDTQSGLSRLGDRLDARIAASPHLDEATKAGLRLRLRSMPSGLCLCHGDVHPGNVILSAEGLKILDWIDASVGPAAADVARTSVLFLGHIDLVRRSKGDLAPLVRFHEIYLQWMVERGGIDRDEYSSWIPLVAAARLDDGIEEFREFLLSVACGDEGGDAYKR